MENGKKQILGHPLTWKTWGTKTYYHWYSVLLCTVEQSGDKFVKSFPSAMQTLKEAEVVKEYSTLEQAHYSMLECFKTGQCFFKNLAEHIKAENDAGRKEQEAEKAKDFLTKEQIQQRIDHYSATAEGFFQLMKEEPEHRETHFLRNQFYSGKADAWKDVYNILFPEIAKERSFPQDEEEKQKIIDSVKLTHAHSYSGNK